MHDPSNNNCPLNADPRNESCDCDTADDCFSVCQFFEDESYEYVARYVSAQEAVRVFRNYTTSVGARIGTTKRVIVTDAGDCISMEWEHGKGITFPLPEEN